MKYRTKLYITFAGVALLCSMVGLGVVYLETKEFYLQEFRSHALSIAATTSALLDVEEVQQICYPNQAEQQKLGKIKAQLKKAELSNRREDVYVKHMYLVCLADKQPGQLTLGLVAESGEIEAEKKDISALSTDVIKNINTYYAPKKFLTDKEGIWLSAFAPIYDRDGRYVATLGIDMDAQEVETELYKLVEIGILSLCGSLIVALTIASIFSRKVTHSLGKIFELVHQVSKGNLEYQISLPKNDEFNDLGDAIHEMCKGLLQRERLKMNFARYVSSAVLEKAILSNSLPKLEGERKRITVLFSDLRQFTTMAEKMTPEMVLSLLNEYFEKMIEVIFKHNGTLDKFLGDGLMVEFGTPIEDPFHEKNCILAAFDMQKELTLLNKKWESEGKPTLEMGIGISTGYAIVGNVGAESRMEFTAVGSTVTTAAYLQQSTKKLSVPLLIGEETALAVKELFFLTYLGKLAIPESNEVINVFTIDPSK